MTERTAAGDLSRREFIKYGSFLAAATAFGRLLGADVFARGLSRIADGTVRVVWIQGQSCSGDSVSFLNTQNPAPLKVLTEIIHLISHQTIGAAQGSVSMDVYDKVIREVRDYVLVVEGSIPLKMPEACMIGGRRFNDLLGDLMRPAKHVLALGTCAAFGGIPAAEGNETGAASVREFMEARGETIEGRLLNLPGCPTHPKSLVGTIATVAAGEALPLDPKLMTPIAYYGHSTHDNCPRYHDYERKIFARYYGDPKGCLFMLGCLGPLSHTVCPERQWNGGVNWCVRASAPCIACASADFCRRKDFPFSRLGETEHAVGYREADRKGSAE